MTDTPYSESERPTVPCPSPSPTERAPRFHGPGVGISYYGKLDARHAESVRGILRAGIPIAEVTGCPYPEMGRGELLRQALEYQCECLVMVDADMVFSPEDVREISRLALQAGAIVTATYDRPKAAGGLSYLDKSSSRRMRPLSIEPRAWDPTKINGLSFCAIPLEVIERMTDAETRYYTNTPFTPDGGAVKMARPLFTTWNEDGSSIGGKYQCPDDVAFFLRAQAAGVTILGVELPVKCLSSSGYSIREVNLHRKDHKYALTVACFGGVDHEQTKALFELEKAGMPIIELHGCPYIDMARGELTRRALAAGFEGVFSLDHDIIFIPQSVLDLCSEAERRQAVVGAAYCMRKSGHNIIGAFNLPSDQEIAFFGGGSVMPAMYTGMGFTAIPASVLEGVQAKLPLLEAGFDEAIYPSFSLRVADGFYAGEDVSFCTRVHDLKVQHLPASPEDIEKYGAELGDQWKLYSETSETGRPEPGRIFIDTRVRIFHKGEYCYGIEDVGIVVPRIESLRTFLASTKAKARDMLLSAGELDIETQLAAVGLDTETDSHPLFRNPSDATESTVAP